MQMVSTNPPNMPSLAVLPEYFISPQTDQDTPPSSQQGTK